MKAVKQIVFLIGILVGMSNCKTTHIPSSGYSAPAQEQNVLTQSLFKVVKDNTIDLTDQDTQKRAENGAIQLTLEELSTRLSQYLRAKNTR